MKRVLVTLGFLGLLAGCTSTESVLVPTKQPVVVIPSQNLDVCAEEMPLLPDPETLTQEQAALLIVDLYEFGYQCMMTDHYKTELLKRAQKIIEND